MFTRIHIYFENVLYKCLKEFLSKIVEIKVIRNEIHLYERNAFFILSDRYFEILKVFWKIWKEIALLVDTVQ